MSQGIGVGGAKFLEHSKNQDFRVFGFPGLKSK